MSLVKLNKDQIESGWFRIRQFIAMSLPPIVKDSEDLYTDILDKLRIDMMQCWALLDDINNVKTIVVTEILKDAQGSGKTLLIFSLSSVEELHARDFADGFEILKRYAKLNNCYAVTGYSRNDSIVSYAKHLDAHIESFIRMEVK